MVRAPLASSLPSLALLLAGACADVGPAAAPTITSFSGPTMGSTYEVKYLGTTPVAEVRAAVEAELAAYDAAFSNWRADSELARVNAHASVQPIAVGERFAAVLTLALAVAAATEGAFDPTVKPLLDVYRAAKADPQHRLDPAALAAAKARVGHTLVRVQDGTVVKARPDVLLDLDGLVAGAACDAIAAKLQELGVGAFYLEVTGEVRCRGEKANGQPWVLGIEDPRAALAGRRDVLRTVPLRDLALCTSGDYRNGFVADGTYVHHVFDPRTGRSAATGIVSASVLAPSAGVADAIGTALLVLGEQDTQRLWPALQRLGARSVLLVLAEGEALRQVEIAWPSDRS
jgi:thiamine biosynthesis lipoprotein